MPDAFRYPSNTVWFLRAVEAGHPPSEGSAVALRLRKKGCTDPYQNYLVTCAHVIRRAGTTVGTFGPCYAEIKAWRSGSGYNPANGHSVVPVRDVHPIDTSAGPAFYQQDIDDVPNADWALLEFENSDQANAQDLPTAQIRGDAAFEQGTKCDIYGFPGGSKSFEGHDHARRDIVKPCVPYGHQVVTAAANGVIEFQGSQCRRGMSGGGVFLIDSEAFVGLHRERDDSALQLHAVSAFQIKRVLDACGYEVVPPNDSTRLGSILLAMKKLLIWIFSSSMVRWLVALALVMVAILVATIVVVPWLTTPAPPPFVQREKAVATNVGKMTAEFDKLEERYGSNVYLLVTAPIEKQRSPSGFLLYSTENGDQLEVRGVIESAAPGSRVGELVVDPAGKASETVRLQAKGGSLRRGERLRLLVGATHTLGHEEYLKSIKLER